jgi:methylmalonyl-CoA mutase, N-terminal domain
VQNDILKEYIARGTYRFPPGPSMRLITDVFAYCREHVPNWNTVSISGYHMREAGCTAVQEIAFTLANGLAYAQAAIDRGLAIDEFGPQLSFFFACDRNFFEEVAKFRAARRLWARLARERLGARDPRAWMLRFHTQTSGASLTAQQPENNVVRVALQALAAVLGGTQSLHTNSRDEALALPTEESVQVALRTQQIIAYETGVGDTPDPLGGAYFIETLTDELERRALESIEHIDSLGGALRAIEAGYVQREIQESAYRFQRAVETGDQVIVGVNRFTAAEEQRPKILRVSPATQAQQIERVQALRARRDAQAHAAALAALARAAETSDNLLPHLVTAVEAWATVGEICSTLETVFGEYSPTLSL